MRTALTCSLLFLAILSPRLVFATAQRGDVLLLNGKTYSIQTNPLRPFLEKNPNKIPQSDVTSSSCGEVTWPLGKSRTTTLC